ncbi:MAG: formylglycine-generating enzyme family protein [Bacteroidales bacterium]|jgi:formylglycine-generating enzyme required for sulfatase activity|nr:formylglycine-generating enzyme family protein [Bacteroidales bacterium]
MKKILMVAVIATAMFATLNANGQEIEMVFVKGGTFMMGSNDGDSDEKPVHSVTLSDFYIGKYEVTQAQWKAVMGNNPSYFKGDNLPVEQVSWDDVQEFIKRLNAMTGKNYRLPTEAEWEFAARGGNSSNGYTYSGSNSIGSVAWYDGNSGSETHTVGTKQANELGIYDMTGNVWEWCSDWYDSYSGDSQTNPQGANSGSYRVGRGGGWGDGASSCRVAGRYYTSPVNRYYYRGFRLACSSK